MDVVRFYTLKDLLYRWQIEDSVFVCNYRLYLYVLAVFVGCTEISVLIHFAVNCNFITEDLLPAAIFVSVPC